MSLRIDISGFDPRDVRVLVDRKHLLVDATAHFESSRSTPIKSRDVTSGYSSDVTHRRLSRRYLLPGHVRASDLHCAVTSDNILSIEGQLRQVVTGHATSARENGGKIQQHSNKHVKFDVL